VKAGDTVAVGQALATVDTLQLNAALLSAKADLATAQATLSDLQAAGGTTAAATAQIQSAQARVAVTQAAVTTAETAMGEATLVAPVAGLVTSLNLTVGQPVTGTGSSSSSSSSAGTGSSGSSGSSGIAGASGGAASSSSSSSTGQFEIVGTGAYDVSLSVNDSNVAQIQPGDQVELTSTDLTATVFGVVRTIGPLSTSTGVASYPVMVDVTSDPATLHDGISVTARIIYERRANVLTVPTAAIAKASDGTSTVTKVAADGSTSKVSVTTGESSGTVTEITAGLAEGDRVQVTTYARSTTSGSTQNQQSGGGTFPGGGSFPGGGTLPGGGNFQLPSQVGTGNRG
jgi:macrolide-specific efflux system membrane fusion protein